MLAYPFNWMAHTVLYVVFKGGFNLSRGKCYGMWSDIENLPVNYNCVYLWRALALSIAYSTEQGFNGGLPLKQSWLRGFWEEPTCCWPAPVARIQSLWSSTHPLWVPWCNVDSAGSRAFQTSTVRRSSCRKHESGGSTEAAPFEYEVSGKEKKC